MNRLTAPFLDDGGKRVSDMTGRSGGPMERDASAAVTHQRLADTPTVPVRYDREIATPTI
jgi:hypothetical protein